jgi:putative hydrolase of the HAD superfamily
MPIRAVLFDMFDTLMLIEKNHAFYSPSLKKAHSYLVKNGVDVEFRAFRDAYIKARNALYYEADTKLEEPHFNCRISNALRSLGYVEVQRKIVSGATNKFCEGFMEYVRIDDHARSTLEKLYGKYKLGIVSNFAIPECVEKLLEKNGLEKFFDVVVVSATVNKRKPSPEIFQKALEKLDVRAENTVFVGDTVDSDIIGAKAAGIKSIFIERRKQEGVNQACPNEIIKSLNELLEAMKNC